MNGITISEMANATGRRILTGIQGGIQRFLRIKCVVAGVFLFLFVLIDGVLLCCPAWGAVVSHRAWPVFCLGYGSLL